MRAIEHCRTAVLGGHVERCGHCSHQRISYNSCRNRHCPKCQNPARAEWLQRRKSEVLPVEYFHVVFTIPQPLHALALQNRRVVYDRMFQTSAATLQTIAGDQRHLGADIGFFSVLHTWGQNLMLHPHIHCVVSGGGLSPDRKRWIFTRPGFFLSVRVLSRLFRRLLLAALRHAHQAGLLEFHADLEPLADAHTFQKWLQPLSRIDWVVYAKPPFGGAHHVLEYLGRYTHRVAIANERLLAFDGQQVTFQYKDYRRSGHQRRKQMTIPADEFIRRFLLHALPPGFQRIRHYGLLASCQKKTLLALARHLLSCTPHPLAPTREELTAVVILYPIQRCPRCRIGIMLAIEILPPTLHPNDSS